MDFRMLRMFINNLWILRHYDYDFAMDSVVFCSWKLNWTWFARFLFSKELKQDTLSLILFHIVLGHSFFYIFTF